ncbi:glycoside hydrolase family 2 [soil metagenome]
MSSDTLISATPKPEYPRPDRDRSDRWLSLNGQWMLESHYGAEPITVPFAWETSASGVERTWLERATYRRRVSAPDWRGRVFLCFGAVHHRAVVRIDGQVVGEHVGGYTSFEFEVTGLLSADSELTVEVDAPADKRSIAHGKQRSIPRDDYDGVAFTPTSGIWQSVWLEARGQTWLDDIVVRGDSCTGFDIAATVLGGVAPVTVTAGTETVELTVDAQGHATGRLELTSPRLWSPADPHLYGLEFTTGDDRVVVAAGLRSIEVRGEQLFLNGQRYYMRGVLDQGYWPHTGATAPDDEALITDLRLAADAGYNLVRKHLKFEEARFYHHADQMGMLIWAEPACPSRFSSDAAANFEEQIAPMVARDGNHPSIIVWGLYNEEWGLDWDIPGSPERAAAASTAYDVLKAIDSTRPIVENSGWSHIKSDLVDWHYYDEDPTEWARNVAELASGEREEFPVKLGPDFIVDKSFYGSAEFPRSGVPILNSEYGAGFTSLERAWHMRWQTQELRRHDRFAGYVYTELADIEHEAAGLYDTNRSNKDWGGLVPAHANADTVLVVNVVPKHAGADIEVPVADLVVEVHVSQHTAEPMTGTVHAAWVDAGARFEGAPQSASSSTQVTALPFELSPAVTVTVPPPGRPARLLLWLSTPGVEVAAMTFVDAAPIEAPNLRGARAVS